MLIQNYKTVGFSGFDGKWRRLHIWIWAAWPAGTRGCQFQVLTNFIFIQCILFSHVPFFPTILFVCLCVCACVVVYVYIEIAHTAFPNIAQELLVVLDFVVECLCEVVYFIVQQEQLIGILCILGIRVTRPTTKIHILYLFHKLHMAIEKVVNITCYPQISFKAVSQLYALAVGYLEEKSKLFMSSEDGLIYHIWSDLTQQLSLQKNLISILPHLNSTVFIVLTHTLPCHACDRSQ